MNELRFQAIALNTGRPVAVEVFVEDGSRGVTPRGSGEALTFRSAAAGPQRWYAMAWGRRVAHGRAAGGAVLMVVDPRLPDGAVFETNPAPESSGPHQPAHFTRASASTVTP